MTKRHSLFLLFLLIILCMGALIIQTDFGLYDGAVNAMYGVAYGVSKDLDIFNLMHEIKPFDIWDASYRLTQVINYWPEETVFVSVVDPGVGTNRKSVVAKTNDNRYIVTPNNGTLTHTLKKFGIKELREIDESVNRLKNSYDSYTFHGRDVYVYTAARLAAGVITYEQVGPKLDVNEVVTFDTKDAYIKDDKIVGIIDVLDKRFGSPWTNITHDLIKQIGIDYGDNVSVVIKHDNKVVYEKNIPLLRSFGETEVGEELVFINSLLNVSFAVNQGSFAERYDIDSGPEWIVEVSK